MVTNFYEEKGIKNPAIPSFFYNPLLKYIMLERIFSGKERFFKKYVTSRKSNSVLYEDDASFDSEFSPNPLCDLCCGNNGNVIKTSSKKKRTPKKSEHIFDNTGRYLSISNKNMRGGILRVALCKCFFLCDV